MSVEALHPYTAAQSQAVSPGGEPSRIGPLSQEAPASAERSPRYDEYVPGETSSVKGIGLYHPERDEQGAPRIAFDAPQEKKAAAADDGAPEESKAERCTTNTDQVDREIRQLSEEKKRLERAVETARDPEKRASQEQQLAAVEAELLAKDNDAYRRQHAVYTFG